MTGEIVSRCSSTFTQLLCSPCTGAGHAHSAAGSYHMPQGSCFKGYIRRFCARAVPTLMRSRLTSLLGRSATASTAFTQISAMGRFKRPTLHVCKSRRHQHDLSLCRASYRSPQSRVAAEQHACLLKVTTTAK